MESNANAVRREPWNKGKIVGQDGVAEDGPGEQGVGQNLVIPGRDVPAVPHEHE